jgi:hypothetical protein
MEPDRGIGCTAWIELFIKTIVSVIIIYGLVLLANKIGLF